MSYSCDSNNLVTVNPELKNFDTQLSLVDDLLNPLSYYGGDLKFYTPICVSYISDIHLLHHVSDKIDMSALIHNTIKSLYESMGRRSNIVIFSGDICSDPILTVEFYSRFMRYADYISYKSAKKVLLEYKNNSQSISSLINRIDKIERFIFCCQKDTETIKSKLSKYLDFKLVEQYKKRYFGDYTWEITINGYKTVKSYLNKRIPHRKCNTLLNQIASKLDYIAELEKRKERYILKCEHIKEQCADIENEFGRSINKLTMKDYYKRHHLLSDELHVIVVLGNHEYIGFSSVKDAVDYYDQALTPLGIKFLHNDYIYDDENKFVIYGGTGFAKYNEQYNANTVVCCTNFTREDELYETGLFEDKYLKAKKYAFDKKYCFICVSHYPIRDCCSHVDNDTIYFYGHNHQNYFHRNEEEIIYADNQIGYKNPIIAFKTMTSGIEINPYVSLDDGLYETTVEDYLQFYRYLGESVGEGKLLNKRCQSDQANMYVIKRNRFYGFFILNTKSGSSKGISIVNGGKTKKITSSIDLQWLYDNFEIVLFKYLQILAPLRSAQQQIADELKELGFSGSIHGCIVDIDFYHHIMLNPLDGTMTYYYSPFYGLVEPLATFDQVIASMEKHYAGLLLDRDYRQLEEQYNANKKRNNHMLSKIDKSGSLMICESAHELSLNQMQTVSRSKGMYGISRRINSLQRLFSGHVLRDFDINLVESKPANKVVRSSGKAKPVRR